MPKRRVIIPRKICSQGYIQIYQPEHHRADPSGYVYEHIVIAEQKIGRLILFKNEAIHHIDRDKTNNDPDNLMVLSHSDHARIHSKDRIGKRTTKRFRNVSSGGKEVDKYEPLAKEKLPRGYHYMRTLKNKSNSEKNNEKA